MGKYWLKIALGATLIFVVGFGILSAARHVRHTIESDADITIPLGGFIPFKLDGAEVGKLRSLTIHRSEARRISGFGISMRLSDSALFDKLRECRFSVTDPSHIDERTTFYCLQSDSGFREFGEVRMSLRGPGGTQTLIQPLLLPEHAISDFQRKDSDPVAAPVSDSILSAVRLRVRAQERVYNDSVEAARLEKRAKDMQRRADSLRSKVTTP